MASFKAVEDEKIPAALRPLAAEEADAAKGWPELHLDAASWVEDGQVWVLELEPCHAEMSPTGGKNLEEICQSASTERADSESLAKGVAVSESHYQSDESKTIPLACQWSKNTFPGDQEAVTPMNQTLGVMINHAKNLHACDHGGISLQGPSPLAQHHKNVHCESEATKQNQKELEVFRPSLLHQKSQSRPTKLPHICNQCGKEFRWPSDLARHEHVHSRRNAARQNLCNLEACCPGSVVPVLLQAKNTFANSYKTLSEDSDSTSCTKNHHVCDQCGKAFQWRSSLVRHHRYEHFRGKAVRRTQGLSEAYNSSSLAPFLLEVENTVVDSSETLHPTAVLTTDQSTNFRKSCISNQCEKTFQFLSDQAQQEFTHTRGKLMQGKCTQFKKPYICDQCGKKFRYPSEFARHEQTHTRRKQQKSHLCDLCDKAFQWAYELARHKWTHSGMKASTQSLSWSQKHSAKPMNQTLGVMINHAKNLHACDHGGISLQWPSPLAQHHKNVHCESEATKQNQKELEVFRPSLLHQKLQSRPTKLPHICNQCGKDFRWPSDLARHEHVHSRRNAARQNLCNLEACCSGPVVPVLLQAKNIFANSYKTLSENSDSTSCTKNHHVCDQCGKAFQWRSSLARHHRYEHFRGKAVRRTQGLSEAYNSSSLAPFLSEVENTVVNCETLTQTAVLTTDQSTNFRKQQKSHLYEQCGQSFTCDFGFVQHLSTHSSERPYACAICGSWFRHHVQLEQHQKWHKESHEMEEAEDDQKYQGARRQDLPAHQLRCLDLQSSKDEKSFASLKSCECGECYPTACDSLGMPLQNGILEIGLSGVPHILPITQTCECGDCGIDGGNSDMKSPELPHLKEVPSALSTKSIVLSNSSEDHKSMAYMQREKVSTTSSPTHARWLHAVAGQSHKRSPSPSNPIWLPEQASALAGKEKTLSCPICPKQFSLPSYLMKHLGIHQPGKPYQCTTCKKCFAQHSYLLKHQKVHSVNLVDECPDCGKRFTQISYLRKHMRIHTKQKH